MERIKILLKIISLSLFFELALSTKLPSYFNKCSTKQNFNDCILDNIKKSLPNIVLNGDDSMKLSHLNPMRVKEIKLQASPSLSVKVSNVEILGFLNCDVYKINMETEAKKFDLNMKCVDFQVTGNYDLKGKILIMAIEGNGNINISTKNIDVSYNSKLEDFKKNGANYLKAANADVDATPEIVYFFLDNLFNRDERLGMEMNKFLNENWRDVFEEMKSAMTGIISSVVTTIINAYFTNIPATDLYDE